MVQLPFEDMTVADSRTRCGRIQTDDYSSVDPKHRIEFLSDDLSIKSMGIEQAFQETVEWNIVISWNN